MDATISSGMTFANVTAVKVSKFIYKETPKDYVKRLAQEYEQQLRSGGMTDENQIANEIEERFSLSLFNEIYRSF